MAKRIRPPVPRKECKNFVVCKKTLSVRSKFSKCTNCRNADKRYKENGFDWCFDAYQTTVLRQTRLMPFCGEAVASIPKPRILRKVG